MSYNGHAKYTFFLEKKYFIDKKTDTSKLIPEGGPVEEEE